MKLCGHLFAVLGLMVSVVRAAETLPAPPKQYFNDYANVVSRVTAQQLNSKLEEFERTNSSQILVAIFPQLPEGAAMEDWTIRTFQHWKAGQKGKDNGAIFFVFVRDRKMRIEVGYGLEGALPDIVANQILADVVRPRLQRNDWNGAMSAAVDAIFQAVRGEYRGTGRTVADRPGARGRNNLFPPIVFGIFFLCLLAVLRRARGTVYRPHGRSRWGGGWPIGGGGGGWSGGGGGGGGWSGGGFSGGGGQSGGGGASGSW